MRIYTLFFFLILAIFFPCATSMADTFKIHVLYDQKKDFLNFDESSGASVEKTANNSIGIVEFNTPEAVGKFEYTLFDITGAEIISVQFDSTPGNFSLELPYFSIAKTVKIKRSGEQNYFLEKDISNLLMCNDNKVCEFEKGETMNTCIADCASSHIVYSAETQSKLDANQGVLKDPRTGDTLLDVVKVVAPEIPTTEPVATPQATTNNAPSTMMSLIYTAIALIALGYCTYFIYRKW